MKKQLLSLSVLILFMCIPIQAGDNSINVGVGFPRTKSIEYERKASAFLPGLTTYINYGASNSTVESISTKLNGINVGARYRIPFLIYIGIGYGKISFDYSYFESVTIGSITAGDTVSIDGSLNGLLIEVGRDFSLGPINLGVNAGYVMGSPSITAKVGSTTVDASDVNSGLATIKGIPQFSAYAGLSF